MRDYSISVYFARAVLKNAVARGLDPIGLLRKNRISPRLLLEEGARNNPTSSRLEFELASAYQRKLSPFSVDRKIWLLHVRRLHEDLQKDADRRAPRLVASLGVGKPGSRDSAEEALRSMGIFAIPAVKAGAGSFPA